MAGSGSRPPSHPRCCNRTFGIAATEVTGSYSLGWRLFATRNLYLTARAVQGDPIAIAAFGHVQALDQVVFWQAFATRSVPRRTAVLAATTSTAMVGLDLHRRTAG